MKHLYVIIIAPATVVIPLAAGALNRSFQNKQLKFIYWYLLFVTAIEIIARVLGARGINNLPLLHFYTLAEFFFIMRFFQLVLDTPASYRIISWLMLVFAVFCVADLLFIQSVYQFNSYPRPLAALFIVAGCMYYFYSNPLSDHSVKWHKDSLNLIITGLLVYFGSAFFHFAFLDFLYRNASLQVNYIFGDIHATLVIAMYLLIAIGFYYAGNKR